MNKIPPLVMQNMRPFHTLQFEYTVEHGEGEVSSWKLKERHQVAIDFTRGYYKDFHVSAEQGLIIIQKETWNGIHVVTLAGTLPYDKELKFVDFPKRNLMGSIAPRSSQRRELFFPLQVFYRHGQHDPLYAYLSNLDEKGRQISIQKKENFLEMTLNGYMKFLIDPASGTVKEKTMRVFSKNNRPYDHSTLVVEKYIGKDGWQFPISSIGIFRNPDRNFILKKRYTVIPNSIKVNVPPDKLDFSLLIPVGTQVTDTVREISYTARELDPISDTENVARSIEDLARAVKADTHEERVNK